MNTDDSLSKIFDIEPMDEKVVEVETKVVSVESNNHIQDDYDHSRNNIHELLVKGKEALETALTVAKQSEHPRAFEVVGNLMKQLADMNQQLLDIHQQKKKIDEPSKAVQSNNTTNNAIFVGSTAELNKMISNMTKGE
jgi:hypothetical protein